LPQRVKPLRDRQKINFTAGQKSIDATFCGIAYYKIMLIYMRNRRFSTFQPKKNRFNRIWRAPARKRDAPTIIFSLEKKNNRVYIGRVIGFS